MADTNNPIPGIPPALLQALAQAPSRGAAGLDALNQSGLFQGLQQGFGNIAQMVQQKKQKENWLKTINSMMSNPNVSPQMKQFMPLLAQQPELAGNFMGAMTKKQNSPWRVVSGMVSDGKPVQQNEETGEVRTADLQVTPTGRGNSDFGSGSVTWEAATPEDRDLAKALYEGRIRTSDVWRNRGTVTKLAEEYALKNGLPPFKSYAGDVASGTAKSFASGKLGMNTLSLNTALGHVNSAYDAYKAVGNTNQQWLNKPLNKLREETNDPNVIKLGLTLNALRGELATVFKGSSGTDLDAKNWADYLTENLTPAQFYAAVPQVDELLRSRLSALNYQRDSGMSGRGETPLLSPKAATVSKRFGANRQTGSPGVGPYSDPAKEARYQAWKKSQGQ